jgi:predicted dehydrogenase
MDDLLADGDVDAWLIATSTPTHPELARRALAAGLHVLCEKPLALDVGESADLGRRAEQAGRVLQVGFWRRFSPPWARARELVAAGDIGEPLMVRLSQWDADPPPPQFCDPAVSGGLAVDCGVHEFDLAEWLTGLPIERVRGHRLPPVDESVTAVGDVDNLLVLLHLAGGAIATVDLSRNARYDDDVRTEILGSQGALFVDLLPGGRTRIGDRDGMRVVSGSEAADATAAGVAEQARAFAAAVAGSGAAVPDAATSARTVQIARAVETSIEENTEVAVPAHV